MYEEILSEIRAEFPEFEVIRKDQSSFMLFLDRLLKLISFGKMGSFLVSYTTTINNTIYVPANWESIDEISRVVTLRHERVHMRQARQYGFFLFAILYLFFPLPVIFAMFRTQFEREAYEETIKANIELRPTAYVLNPNYRNFIVSQFTGSGYLWMFPFKSLVTNWYEKTLDDALMEFHKRDTKQ